jgi:hypothetical protein
MVIQTYDPSFSGVTGRKTKVPGRLRQEVRLYLKNNLTQKGKGVAEVVEHLPTTFKAVNSNPRTAQNWSSDLIVDYIHRQFCFITKPS